MHQLQLNPCQKKKKNYLYFGAKGKVQRTLEVLAAKKTNYVTAGAWETH